MRCTLLSHTARGEMISFVVTVEVTLQTQGAPHVQCLFSSIHMRACEIPRQGSLTPSIGVHKRGDWSARTALALLPSAELRRALRYALRYTRGRCLSAPQAAARRRGPAVTGARGRVFGGTPQPRRPPTVQVPQIQEKWSCSQR